MMTAFLLIALDSFLNPAPRIPEFRFCLFRCFVILTAEFATLAMASSTLTTTTLPRKQADIPMVTTGYF